jgi:ParB family chromosome partitioning protein
MVPVGSIQQSDSQLREVDKESAKFLNMVASIKQVGVLNSVSARYIMNKDTQEDELVLIDGAHRLNAAREAGLAEIPVQILDLDEAQTLSAQIIGNLQRIEQKPYQVSSQLNRLAALDENLTVDDMARMIGETRDYVKSRLSLIKLLPEVGALVDSGAIVPMAACALAKLPEEDQVEFANKAMKAATATEFAEQVNTLLKDRRAAKAAAKREAGESEGGSDASINTPQCRKAGDIKTAYSNKEATISAIVNQNMTAEEGASALFDWIMQMDAESVLARTTAAEARAKAEAARRAKAAEGNKAKKLDDLAKKMEALRAEIGGATAAPAA